MLRGWAAIGATVVLAACSASAATIVVHQDAGAPAPAPAPPTTVTSEPAPTLPPTVALLSDPSGVGQPWGSVPGILTFHGNPTRTWYGTGPVPATAAIAWRYPQQRMCAPSSEYGKTTEWCGTGWVGQPAVFERGGRTWVVFGAYDRNIHFVDSATGADILAPFGTGDLAKGTVTVDPDGFPLVYGGSRDGKLRILAIDRPAATELWALDALDPRLQPSLWNNDWDGSPLIVGDYLVTGGENSRFHVVKLNRSYGPDGLARVDPQLVFTAPTWDDDLLRSIGDQRVSVEGSVALIGDTAYFSNSGGLLQGWDLSTLRTGQGEPVQTFRYWTGDDTDASVVADAEGFLYVGQEWDRRNDRGRQVGQLLKIDPRHPEAPVVWSIHQAAPGEQSGTWSTPAIAGDLLVWPTYPGPVFGIDRNTGAVRWTVHLPWATMSSPVIVDGVWMQADATGVLHAFDLGDGVTPPVERWRVQLPANIESTPAVWQGRIYVGSRDGYLYAIARP